MAHVQHQLFGHPVGMGRAFANRFQGVFQQGVQAVRIGGHFMDDTQPPGFFALKADAGEGQPPGLGQADALHHKGGDLGGNHAQAGFRQAESGAGVGKRHIGNAGQTKAAPQDRTLQYRNQHLGLMIGGGDHFPETAIEFLEGVTVAAGGLLAGTGHILDVAAGTEVTTGTAQYDGADIGIILHRFEHGHQLVDHGQAHGVTAVGAVQGDVQNRAVLVQRYRFGLW